MREVFTNAEHRVTALANRELLAGARAALPPWLGITPYGLAFGLLGPAVGLGVHGTLAMSLFVFAGSAQFIALGLLGSGASYALIVLATLVVNLQHLLYAASLAPQRTLHSAWRSPYLFGALAAGLAAWRGRNLLLTIAAGMVGLWLARLWLG